MNVTEGKTEDVLRHSEDVMSEDALESSIFQLRQILAGIGGGLLFFDIRSFYAYIDYFLTEADSCSAKYLLDKLEPYIPIVVSDDNIETFLEAAVRNDVSEIKQLERQFKEKSKIQFVRALLAGEDEDLWIDTIDTCKMLRDYRAEGMPV